MIDFQLCPLHNSTETRRSSETEGRDWPLCPNILISLEHAEKQQIDKEGGGREGTGDASDKGEVCVCVCVRMARRTGGAERHIPRRADWLLGPRCSALFVRALSADSSQRAHTLLQQVDLAKRKNCLKYEQ